MVYNDKEFIREQTAFAFSRIAEYYKLKRDFKSVYECYHNSSLAYKLFEGNLNPFFYWLKSMSFYLHKRDFKSVYECYHNSSLAYRKKFFESNLKLKPIFYLYNSMSSYYLGRSLINDFIALPYDPKESKVILKKAVECFEYAVENVNIYGRTPPSTEIYRAISTQTETRFYPICHGIYSIYLDYFSIRLDIGKKKINLTKIKEKISKVQEQCRLLDTEKGKSIVDLFDKFVSALGAIIEAYDLKSKGFDASLGEKASIEYQIEKKEIKVKELLTQINEVLDNLETPILKEIGKEEKNIIEKLTLRLKVDTEFSFWDRILNKHGIAATLAAFFVGVIYGVMEIVGLDLINSVICA